MGVPRKLKGPRRDTLLSGNAKHFKEVPLLDAVMFRP